MRAATKRRLWLIAVVVICLVGVLLVFLVADLNRSRKESRIRDLEAQALDITANERVIDAIAAYDDQLATEALLRIAKGASIPGVRAAAVTALVHRCPNCTDSLAWLLVPQESLDVRRAVADALTQGCSETCIRAILHYKERLWWGEMPAERTLHTPHSSKDVIDGIAAEAEEINRSLNRTLEQHENDTLSLMVETYGLGGRLPSLFALDLARTLRLNGACRLSRNSAMVLRESPLQQDRESEVLKELDLLIIKKCTGRPDIG